MTSLTRDEKRERIVQGMHVKLAAKRNCFPPQMIVIPAFI